MHWTAAVRWHPDLHRTAGRVGGEQAEQVGGRGPDGLPRRVRARLQRPEHREGELPAEHRRLARTRPGILAQRRALRVQGGTQSLRIGAAGRHQPLTYRDRITMIRDTA